VTKEVLNAYTPPVLIDPTADRSVYKQLADIIRAQIQSGEFRPGQRLPAQKDYMYEHGVSRATVDRAMTVLRNEGLVVVKRGGSRVRQPEDRILLRLSEGKVSARVPTEPERRLHGIQEGVSVFVIKRDGHGEEIYPADEVDIEIVCDHAPVPNVMAG
jgi:DNA-binding transcriptional regulator YhcF (GntR family)